MHPVAKAALIVAAEVVGVVVGGIVLEHILRRMDAGMFHLPGLGYWRPGESNWNPNGLGQSPDIRRGLAPLR